MPWHGGHDELYSFFFFFLLPSSLAALQASSPKVHQYVGRAVSCPGLMPGTQAQHAQAFHGSGRTWAIDPGQGRHGPIDTPEPELEFNLSLVKLCLDQHH